VVEAEEEEEVNRANVVVHIIKRTQQPRKLVNIIKLLKCDVT
jgi:hypothetical protein